ncbi:hypothetical protein CYMTET_9764 [Cymbomonas tetramitiformis]|uniref:Ubiquitin-like domain-containing protein n=1 Tax=Cymbomonas tetramitiformis TaxID=36881 RepID=A0AAE0F633_9CHLO|nr:hypothetical protein CYMTET_37415 [Cymbomonas tetramitiformis]KAK3282489.1 hypothetical protein CYMTET_9764 [Cymbomonas tetramitiformis]
MYVSKRNLPKSVCAGKSFEWVASFLILNYLEFVHLLQVNLKDDAYVELSPPPILDAVWHQHLLDTRGYHAFCQDQFGAMLHHDPGRALPLERVDYDRYFRIARTIIQYKLMDERVPSIQRLVENGIWWPEMTPRPFGPAPPTSAVVPSLPPPPPPTVFVDGTEDEATEENAKDAKRRGLKRPSRHAGEELAAEGSKRMRDAELSRVYVKSLTGKQHGCIVTKNSTMRDVARQIPIDEGPLDQLRLLCNGKVYYGQTPRRLLQERQHPNHLEKWSDEALTEDERNIAHGETVLTLAELGIESDTTFHLVLKLGGC